MSSAFWTRELYSDLEQGDLLGPLVIGGSIFPETPIKRSDRTMKSSAGGGTPWVELPAWHPDNDGIGQFIAAGKRFEHLIVISHGCDIDKGADKPVLVAPVIPISVLPTAAQVAVRTRQKFAAFYLPPWVEEGPEHYVDLRLISTVKKKRLSVGMRTFAMTGDAIKLLHLQLIGFFVRKEFT